MKLQETAQETLDANAQHLRFVRLNTTPVSDSYTTIIPPDADQKRHLLPEAGDLKWGLLGHQELTDEAWRAIAQLLESIQEQTDRILNISSNFMEGISELTDNHVNNIPQTVQAGIREGILFIVRDDEDGEPDVQICFPDEEMSDVGEGSDAIVLSMPLRNELSGAEALIKQLNEVSLDRLREYLAFVFESSISFHRELNKREAGSSTQSND